MRIFRGYAKRYDFVGILFIAPPLIYLFASVIYPLLTIFPTSFHEYVASSQSYVFVGLKHYRRLFLDRLFWQSIRTTFTYATGAVVFHLALGWALALSLNLRWSSARVRNFFRAILLFPWIFSAPATALLWGILYRPRGIVNYFLEQHFGIHLSFLGDPKIALLAVLLANTWFSYPLFFLLILSGLQSINLSLYESARVDGANRVQSFLHITLPLMTPLIMIIIVIDFITTYVFFDLIYIMTRGGPIRTTYLVTFFLYERGLLAYKFGYASAISVFMVIFLFAFLAVYLVLYFRRSQL